jgi:site-specific recombinase XerD
MAHVSRWMQGHNVAADQIESAVVDMFNGSLPATRHLARLRPGAFRPTWEYLRAIGVVLLAKPQPPSSEIDLLLDRYCRYLSAERGLVETTITRNVAMVRPFLAERARSGQLEMQRLTAREITEYVVAQARCRPRSLSRMATALRSLLRFLEADGVTATGLAVAVPTVARRRLAGLPKALAPEQVAALPASCDQGTAVGLRDFAILTLLSRLGLRTGEIARLRLEDIDWRRGEIAVIGKANRHERLPLPSDVGDAIVAYLTRARPTTDARTVFTRAFAPYRTMSRNAVTNVAARAARRVGLGTIHAHRLRHSAATAMLAAGASLSEIGQVLRHRHVLTTAIYAKVDIASLRTVARAWPGPGAAA